MDKKISGTGKHTYPVLLTRDESTGVYMATCRDLPLFNSVGDTVEEALRESVDGLRAAIEIEKQFGRKVPAGSALLENEYPVTVPH